MFDSLIEAEKVIKTFVFEHLDTRKSTIVDYELKMDSQHVDLTSILEHHCSLGESKLIIYDPNINQFISVEQINLAEGYIPRYLLEPEIIMIRFAKQASGAETRQNSRNSECQKIDNTDPVDREGRKSVERTIRQVLEVVKRWRDLHLQKEDILQERFTLQEAAIMVGVSKKSLDDYYYQLRLGELHHFDFLNHLHDKIGVLRTFVKSCRSEKKESRKRKHDRHPRNLKILNYFDMERRKFKDVGKMIQEEEYKMLKVPQRLVPQMEEMKNTSRKEEKSEETGKKDFWEPLCPLDFQNQSFVSNEIFHLQNKFFHDFQVVEFKNSDPYFTSSRKYQENDIFYEDNSFQLLN